MLIEDFKLENWIAKYEKYTKYDLSQTCVQVLTVKELEELCDLELDLKNIRLSYGELYGSHSLKSAICPLYSNCNIHNITVTHGGIGANELALKTFINKGDKVVCIIPCYQQIYSIPKFYGADVYLTDIENLEKTANGAKLICLVNPNNPTGLKFTDEQINLIINTARKNGSYIFADEAYRGISYIKSFYDLYEKAIVTGSMSKAYSLAGIRVGWVAAEKEIIDKINLNREYNTISISPLDDAIAAMALNNHDKIIKRNCNIINKN
ncbi:aminotransferase class I/II-fold pyridoxal phosphate-dependent enzyme, partial [bacterium]|nr:aminotransferase class I/II-fold pyridoxal phosphate-dependent enzyme [bacterium]